MRLVDQLRGVRHTFAANRTRAALTLLGIMIGAGSIVLLASLLRGGEEALVATSQRANDADIVQVRQDDPPAKQSQRTRRELSRRDAESLTESQLLEAAPVSTEIGQNFQAWQGGRKKRIGMVATEPAMLSLYRLAMAQGRFLDANDVRDGTRVCVIGHDVWKDLLEETKELSNVKLTIDSHEWTVVGVLEPKPILGSSDGTWMWDRRVMVPRSTYDTMYNPEHKVGRIYVRLKNSQALVERIRAIEGVVTGTLLRRHNGVQNFKVEGEESHANQERMILDIIKMLLLGTGLLSLFVGGINIMNIMLVTVTERTREIGVRRAIGAAPGAILTQFLLEAVFIAVTGGVIGVLGGVLLSVLGAVGLEHAFGSWRVHIEGWAIALGLGLSAATGIAFGLFPAWRAARLDPVEALRYE
jgi:putative ABC transport system permease protein